MLRLVAILLLLAPGLAHADVSGPATVIDGDTLDVAGERIRLYGIDAPEGRQSCERDGVDWLCGQEAGKALRELVRGQTVTCEARDIDRYGRVVAVCHAGGRDVNAAMVVSGLALAYRHYSADYVSQEAAAKAAGRGLWAGRFVEPWNWRDGARLARPAANDNDPGSCRIKGNVSRSGERIYHLPGQEHYERTRIKERNGERWFCTEQEARAAGWRRAER